MRMILLLALMPFPAVAEGARQVLDCRASTRCDAAGACAAVEDRVTFTLDPVEVGAHGEGRYTIRYGEVVSEATRTGWIGPTVWAEAQDDVQTLTALGETPTGAALLLWHDFDMTAVASTLTFLSCEVTG